jgi:hypothetical protein
MRRVVAVVGAAGLLFGLVSACGTVSETHRAAGIVPADALAYLSLTLDPSLLQKKDLFEIGEKFPAAAKVFKANFDTSRDNLLQQLVKKVCLDYRADVKPWLGSELAVALLPPPRGGSSPAVAVFIKVGDEAKAKVALDRAIATPCSASGSSGTSGASSPVQYRFINGYAVVVAERSASDGTIILDAVENEAAKATGGLAATAGFARAVAQLAGDRLAVGWADVAGLARLVTSAKPTVAGANVSGFGNCDLSSVGFGSSGGQVAFDLRATPSSLILEGVSSGTSAARSGSGSGSVAGGPATLTRGLPGSTLAEATLYGLGPLVKSVLGCAGLANQVDSSFTRNTGLDLNNDVLALLGGESVFVVGPESPGARLPELGFVTQITDQARAQHAVDQVVAYLRNNGEQVTETTVGGNLAYEVGLATTSDVLGGVQPSFELLADRLIVASTPAYLAELASRPASSLGSSADYRAAVGSVSGDATSAQLLVRFAPIRAALDAALTGSAKSTFDRRIAPELAPLRDLVMRSWVHAGTARFELRLTFS